MLLEHAALLNSMACLAATVAVTAALRGRSLQQQLRGLRLLVGYVSATLLLNVYLMGILGGTASTQAALGLSAVTVVVLWVAVYKLWARGE